MGNRGEEIRVRRRKGKTKCNIVAVGTCLTLSPTRLPGSSGACPLHTCAIRRQIGLSAPPAPVCVLPVIPRPDRSHRPARCLRATCPECIRSGRERGPVLVHDERHALPADPFVFEEVDACPGRSLAGQKGPATQRGAVSSTACSGGTPQACRGDRRCGQRICAYPC